MQITDVRKRRGRLYQLYLDGEAAVMVDAAVFDESPYRMGGSIEDEELRRLLEQSQKRRAREKALYLLSMRDHSRAELEKKLRRDAGSEVAAEVAERMEDIGLVDDENYARRQARDLLERRHFPLRRAVQELEARGVARELARGAVEQAAQEAGLDDGQQALALVKKKYYNKLHNEEARRKTAAALARMGFGYEAVRYALTAAQEEPEA